MNVFVKLVFWDGWLDDGSDERRCKPVASRVNSGTVKILVIFYTLFDGFVGVDGQVIDVESVDSRAFELCGFVPLPHDLLLNYQDKWLNKLFW